MSYGFIRSITIDHTQCGSSDSTNFPVLFSPGAISSLKTVANGGHVQNSNGYDIIFTSDALGTTLLSWEVESYDPTTGTILAWVQVPTLSHSADTVIYCVYGNASISSFQGGSTGAAWDSNYAAVYHFTDDGSGNLLAHDSTSHVNNGTLVNTPTLATGQVGKAASFTATSSQAINCGNDSSVEITGSVTIEAWVDMDNTLQNGSFAYMISNANLAASPDNLYSLAWTNTSSPVWFNQNFNSGSGPFTTAPASSGWHRVVCVSDGTFLYIYVNGFLISTTTGAGPGTSTNNLILGALYNGSSIIASDSYTGLLDEARVSNTNRSADYIKADYNNQVAPNSFSTLGSETPLGLQTIDPTSIASRQSFGTPYIVVPGIGPTSIASRQSLTAPGITGGTVTISPATIPTPRAMGLPNIAGPVSPGHVPSQQSFGNPVLNAVQSVAPTSIASRQSFGTPVLAYSTQIAPASIATHRSMGTPAITGGPAFLLPASIPSQQAFGIPSLTGGNPELIVTLGGVLWTGNVFLLGASDTAAPVSYESANPPTIQSQTLGRWTLTIDLGDTTGLLCPTIGQPIIITEGGAKRFSGCIQTVQRAMLMGTEQWDAGYIIYHVTATDKSGICDRRVVKAITYPAGNDVAQTILAIVQSSLNNPAEGITTTPQSVPQDGSLGTLSSDLVFNYDTVTSAFNQIGTLTGTIWYVDPNGVLWFNPFTNLQAAPFSLTATSNNFRSLAITETTLDFATTIYVVSNLNILPGSGTGGGGTGVGSNTETFVTDNGNIGVVFQISPVDGGSYPYFINVSLPIGTLYGVTVNGVVQTQIINIQEWNGQVPTASPQFGPWYFLPGSTTIAAGIVGPAGLPVGATVIINYTPNTSSAAALQGEALIPASPATGDPLGTCGSGTYELTVQVKNISSVDDMNAIAAAELEKRSGKPIQIEFQTDKPGLAPGQLLTVDLPKMFLNSAQFLITSVKGVAADGVLRFGSIFQWDVQGQSNEDPGNMVQWFANNLNRSANALPINQYEDANFVLGAGANISGGLQVTNPYLVKQTGQLLVMYAAAGTPPINQDLIIRFLLNGALVSGQVVIPGGSSANSTFAYEYPSSSTPIFVFNTSTENDVITISASYNVTGPNPIPASNVSATLRWRI